MVKFISKIFPNLTVSGNGKHITFQNGIYKTDNETEIAFLKGLDFEFEEEEKPVVKKSKK